MGFNIRQTGAGVAFIEDGSASVGSALMALTWTAARGATNTVTVGTLPANARLIAINIIVPVVSNAATTATVSVGITGGSATAFTAAQDVKTAIGTFAQTATVGWALSASSQSISCTYTETGAASSAGTITVAIVYAVV